MQQMSSVDNTEMKINLEDLKPILKECVCHFADYFPHFHILSTFFKLIVQYK